MLKPSYYTSAATGCEVDDGSPLGDTAWLGYRATDTAAAEDKNTIQITMDNQGIGDDTRLDVYLEASLVVTVATQNAPDDPTTGSYKTSASASAYGNMAWGVEYEFEEATETIVNDTAGSLTTPKTFLYADPSNPDLPLSTWFASNGGISTVFSYGANTGVVLEALRPEVAVGGEAQAGSFSGELEAFSKTPK